MRPQRSLGPPAVPIGPASAIGGAPLTPQPSVLQGSLRVVLASAIVTAIGCGGSPQSAAPDHAMAFAGPSTKLRATRVVPSLDSPVDERSSTVWCVAWEMALAQAEANVLNGKPLRLHGVGDVHSRVPANSETLLTPNSFATSVLRSGLPVLQLGDATLLGDAFVGRQAGARGPNTAVQIRTAVKILSRFRYDLFPGPVPMVFVDAGGATTSVRWFGIPQAQTGGESTYRGQISILFCHLAGRVPARPATYALDLSDTRSAYQVIVARLPRQPTLRLALAMLAKNEEIGRRRGGPTRLGPNDVVAIPLMHWSIEHRFRNYEGRGIENQELRGAFLSVAWENIKFALDESGARMDASAELVAAGAAPRKFLFDAPFLIVLKKQGAELPAFAMWVNNAELMECR